MSLAGLKDSKSVKKDSECLICPNDGGSLAPLSGQSGLSCEACGHQFNSEDGIPLLFWDNDWKSGNDVTDAVKSFYEETPFPNYEDIDSKWSLEQKAEKGFFARLLNEQLPPGAKVLEAGCGTGQLSNFLGIKSGRTVFGADMCVNSLKMAHQFKEKNEIRNVSFFQMNLFRPVFPPESFDCVISNGVLHHTSDPYLGFQTISKLVKKGGHIIIGLYNKYGRIPTNIRAHLLRITSNRFSFFEPRLKDENVSELRKHTWLMDQYYHPHESKHTIGEVLGWFDREGVEFVKSVPKSTAFDPFRPDEKLFESSDKGSSFDHSLVQLGLLLRNKSEGGFFIMIGKKK